MAGELGEQRKWTVASVWAVYPGKDSASSGLTSFFAMPHVSLYTERNITYPAWLKLL